MLRPVLTLLGAIALAAPALAETPAPAGRYQIVADGDGFIRLDTRTGALSHCARRDGAWRCEALAEDADLGDRLDALGGEVTSLAAEVGRLAAHLAALEEQLGAAPPAAAAPPTASAPSAEDREKEFDEALTFAERLMRRFFDLVRELKNEPPQRI